MRSTVQPPRAEFLASGMFGHARLHPAPDSCCGTVAFGAASELRPPWQGRCRRGGNVNTCGIRCRPGRIRQARAGGWGDMTWATQLCQKNDFSRATVRSMNWSTNERNLPVPSPRETTARRRPETHPCSPAAWSASMLARLGTCSG